jgi:hypothetical protein
MTRAFPVIMALGGFALLGPVSAQAQYPEELRASVPFAFKAGRALLPAGEYELRFDEVSRTGALVVRSHDGRQASIMLAEKAEVPKATRSEAVLVFAKVGDGYVLSEVLDAGDGFGVEILGSPHARVEPDRKEVRLY